MFEELESPQTPGLGASYCRAGRHAAGALKLKGKLIGCFCCCGVGQILVEMKNRVVQAMHLQ